MNPKRKGAAFERDVCKALSLWVTSGARNDVFWRAAMSGGRATNRFKRGVVTGHQAGDISSVHPAGNGFAADWFVECKHVKNLRLQMLLLGTGGDLSKFWTKAVHEAKKYRTEPMIIAKQNLVPTIVLIRDDVCDGFRWARFAWLATLYHRAGDIAVLDFDRMLRLECSFAVSKRVRVP